MKKYKQFNIYTTPYDPETISGFLWELEISGFLDNDIFATIFTGEKSNLSKTEVESLLAKLVDEKYIESFTVEAEEHEEKNWNEEWEKNLNIIRVTDRIVIKPSTKEFIPKEDDIVITIDPKMSFGTGEHETTKIVLSLLEKYVKSGSKVLDVGSGTAVLAIGAIKLGASSGVALDNDDWCSLNGNENTLLNGVEDKIKVVLGELSDLEENNFDLILANINKPILLDIKDLIMQKVNKNGVVILSGLLITDEEDIVNAYQRAGFEVIDKTTMNEWMGLVLSC
ncbi:MAG: 50S ribosomal protein L11 methyltransferase [bacterium]